MRRPIVFFPVRGSLWHNVQVRLHFCARCDTLPTIRKPRNGRKTRKAFVRFVPFRVIRVSGLHLGGVGGAAAVGAGSGVSGEVMSERVGKNELVNRVSQRVGRDTDTVREVVEATLEEIYEALKQGECVSLRNFGTFYVRPQRDTWVFKFRASQRLRKLFGWSSSHKGKL